MLRHLSSIIALIAFVLQQGACCDRDEGANLWIGLGRGVIHSLGWESSVVHHHNHLSSRHVGLDHDHSPWDCPHANPESCGDHDHHLCVGEEVVYLATQAFENADLRGDDAYFAWLIPDLILSAQRGGFGSSYISFQEGLCLLATLPLRAELQNFRC